MRNLSRPEIRTSLGVLAITCACAGVFLGLGQTGGSVTHARPGSDLGGPGDCPIPPCTRYIGPEGREFCECPTPTPTPSAWKGVGHASGQDAHVPIIEGKLRSSWWYNWGYKNSRQRYLSNPCYVAMVSCIGSKYVENLEAHAAVEPRNRTWLVFNEPDHSGQCDTSAVGAASGYDSIYDQIKAGSNGKAQILVGGTVYLVTTIKGENWWTEFLDIVQRPIEGIHIHAYPGEGPDGSFQNPHCEPFYQLGGSPAEALTCLIPQLEQTYQFFQNQPKTVGKPIWITETSLLGRGHFTPEDMRDNFMIPLLDWFVTAKNGQYSLFQGLAWFSDNSTNAGPNAYPDSNLLNLDDSLTPLGLEWKEW